MENILAVLMEAFEEAIEITGIIFLLMVLIEVLVLRYKGFLLQFREKRRFLAYGTASLFGIIPSCATIFVMDSFYMSGYLSFGGLVSVMVSSIDESGLYLLSLFFEGKFPAYAIVFLFISLFLLGIASGYLADFVAKSFKLKFKMKCDIVDHKAEEFKLKHFLKEHIYKHIVRRHIWQIFLWVLITLFIIGLLPDFFSESNLNGINTGYFILIAAFIGLIPNTSPHLVFITIFSQGLIPFSVLLVNSMVQDGHGLLPIFGYSWKDAVKVKIFNLLFALLVGYILLLSGIDFRLN